MQNIWLEEVVDWQRWLEEVHRGGEDSHRADKKKKKEEEKKIY